MPLIRVIDLRQEQRKRKRAPILSEKLRSAISDRIAKREQTILFLNRRGFSTSLLCSNCGKARDCPNCSVALTFHRSMSRLNCHLCGHTAAVPKKCPECGQDALIYVGFGTEKVESTVAQIFPNAVVKRMDADSMTRKEAYRETLAGISCGQDRYSGRDANDRKGPAFSKRHPGWNHQCRSGAASSRFSRGRANVSVAYPGGGTRRPRRNAGRSFRAELHPVFSPRSSLRAITISRAMSNRNWNFASAAIFRHSNMRC